MNAVPYQSILEEITSLATQYDIPPEAVVKSDMLRLGLCFEPLALEQAATFKEKSYFIFSFDRVAQKELSRAERHTAPEEIALVGGPCNFQRTIVSVRLNPHSPYRVSWQEGRFVVLHNQEEICDCYLLERPDYYQRTLANGKPVTDIAPTIEWGYLIYLTAFRLCQYWGEKEECQFCDINENYRQQKRERSYTGIKSPEDILEALEIINAIDTKHETKAYTVTGGAVTKNIDGLTEGAFYARYAEAIEKRFAGRWISKAVVQALPLDEVKLLKDSGFQIYHPNYEVWDAKLFDQLCPGKARYVGRQEWIQRIVDAASVFGPRNVIPNFVAGIEMAEPLGFKTVDEAVSSTRQGLEFFMSQGIVPRFTVWCVEPNTTLSRTNSIPPSLEYYTALLRAYRDTLEKYRLSAPPGYGAPGLGNAVFSVSAFMDVLRPNQPSEEFTPPSVAHVGS